MKKIIINNLKVLVIALILSVGVSYVSAAWNNPTSNPAGGNVATPINVSSVNQVKNGDLVVGGTLTAQGYDLSGESILNWSEICTYLDNVDC